MGDKVGKFLKFYQSNNDSLFSKIDIRKLQMIETSYWQSNCVSWTSSSSVLRVLKLTDLRQLSDKHAIPALIHTLKKSKFTF